MDNLSFERITSVFVLALMVLDVIHQISNVFKRPQQFSQNLILNFLNIFMTNLLATAMAVNPVTVVWPLTSRGRSLICFCYSNRDLLFGFLIMSDFLGKCQLLFLDNNIMPAQWPF